MPHALDLLATRSSLSSTLLRRLFIFLFQHFLDHYYQNNQMEFRSDAWDKAKIVKTGNLCPAPNYTLSISHSKFFDKGHFSFFFSFIFGCLVINANIYLVKNVSMEKNKFRKIKW
jgi:hypothetical protein